MQDVTPPADKERSIRNIPVPPGRRHFTPLPEEYTPKAGGSRRRSFWLWAGAIVLACILLGMLASFLLTGATVTVYPREASVTFPATLTAQVEAPVGSLSYQLASAAQSAEATVPSSGTTQVTTSAQGTITIYNNYSTKSQKLITNTRFQAPNGNIYRIHSAITIPGATKGAGGVLTPGSTEAVVYADAPGASYNVGPTRFTIPGFQGTAEYSAFYATTESISGGFSGTEPSVAPSALSSAEGQLEQQLSTALKSTIANQLQDGFLGVGGTFSPVYGNPVITGGSGNQATITIAATGTEAMVRSSDLANAIAKQTVQGYAGEAINFATPSALSLSVATSTPYDPTGSNVTFSISGSSPLVWQFDPYAIQQALAGKDKSTFDSIIATFSPAVTKANASLRPFWISSFPSDPSKIQIVTQLGS
ncbi:MAG: hypothetical protein KGJ34_01585 [Patescibacteria group bacterium]|nr:hypothetical protein [Patescibacteria group bacterium]